MDELESNDVASPSRRDGELELEVELQLQPLSCGIKRKLSALQKVCVGM